MSKVKAAVTIPTPRILSRASEPKYFFNSKELVWWLISFLIAFSLIAWPVYYRTLAMLFGETTVGAPTSLFTTKAAKGRKTEWVELEYLVHDHGYITNSFPVGFQAHRNMQQQGLPVSWTVWYLPAHPRIAGIQDDYHYTQQVTLIFLSVIAFFFGIIYGVGSYLKYIREPAIKQILTCGDPVRLEIGRTRLATTTVIYQHNGKRYRKRVAAAKLLYAPLIDGELYGFVSKTAPKKLVIYGALSYRMELPGKAQTVLLYQKSHRR